MKKIRVLHVGIDSHLGGIETYLLKISQNVNKSLFQFDFLSYWGENPCFQKELSSLGCVFHFVTSRRKNYFLNIKELRYLLKTQQYDIVHCHLNSLSYITPVLEAVKAESTVIIHSRNGGTVSQASSVFLGRVNYHRIPFSKVHCVAVSDKAGKWMFRNHDFKVFNNGLDTNRYRFCEASRNKIRLEFGLSLKTEVLLNVGAFRFQKNHERLIEIFSAYHKRHADSILILVGEGELEESIRTKVSELCLADNVIFAGKRNDIPELLSASDSFVMPSFYEGFPNALLEAETSGLWCVVSSTISDQACLENCTKVDLDASLSDWVTAIERNPGLNRQCCIDMVRNAGFDIEDEMRRLEAYYLSLVEGKS